jgi:O-antigen ligase
LAASHSSSSRRRSRKTRQEGAAKATPIAPAQLSRSQVFAWWTIAVALCAAAWIVDPFADDAFDAPKRLCVLAGALLASVALLWHSPPLNWRAWPAPAKWILAAALAGMLCVLFAACASPHPELAWPSLRRFVVMALFAALGASRLLDGAAGARMFAVFVIACSVNALLSLAQSGGLEFLPVAQVGGRFNTGALLGNEGYVALACAMLAASNLACAMNADSRRTRVGFVLLAGLGLAVIVLNQQKTAAVGLAAALVAVAAVRWRMRWLLAGMAGLLALGATTALIPPLRAATWGTLPLSSYQQLTTYRIGPWIAALDMASERPLSGYGPGTFAAEMQAHQFAAEIRLRERLGQPTGASFVHAHQDYLQLAAEAGIPALLLFLAAILALFTRLALRAPATLEQQVLVAILGTGLIVALGWFPMHIPFTACVLLLCAGRAWRLIATPQQVPQ